MSHSMKILSNVKECQYVAFRRQKIIDRNHAGGPVVLCPTRVVLHAAVLHTPQRRMAGCDAAECEATAEWKGRLALPVVICKGVRRPNLCRASAEFHPKGLARTAG